jgi:hypothetical protein
MSLPTQNAAEDALEPLSVQPSWPANVNAGVNVVSVYFAPALRTAPAAIWTVPEILVLPVRGGHAPYLEWLAGEVR